MSHYSLGWQNYIDTVCARLSAAIFMIKRMKQISNLEVAKLTYHSGLHSIATYCIIVWGHSTESQKIFMKLKRALITLLGLNNKTSFREHFKKEGILTIPSCFIFSCLKCTRMRPNMSPTWTSMNTTQRKTIPLYHTTEKRRHS